MPVVTPQAGALEALAQMVAARRVVEARDGVLHDVLPSASRMAEQLKTHLQPARAAGRSSVGAWMVTRLAVDWVPSGLETMRHAPLDRDGMQELLHEADLDPCLLFGWDGAPADYVPGEGLELDRLAGLAERSLTRDEQALALHQVAYSPQDSARFVQAARWVQACRRALVAWPAGAVDGGLAVLAVSLGRRSRADRARRADLLRVASGRFGGMLAFLSEATLIAAGAEPLPEWPAAASVATGDLEASTESEVVRGDWGPDLFGLQPRGAALSFLDETDLIEDVRAHYEALRGALDGQVPAGATPLLGRARALAFARRGEWAEAQELAREPDRVWLEARASVRTPASPAEAGETAAGWLEDLQRGILLALSDRREDAA
jgi:hypothetical protein